MMHFEDIEPGEDVELGTHLFTAEAIIAFARAYDPQPFHLSEEAGKAGLFGGLSASGWHTASAWMKLMVAHREREAAAGRGIASGPSPGLTDLRWLKPVLAGDTIRYFNRVTDKRLTRGRPDWGLVFSDSRGENQHGVAVLTFRSAVYVKVRGEG